MAGRGGLANIASILGASGITFKPADDSDDDDEGDLHVVGDQENQNLAEAAVSSSGGVTMEDKAEGYLDNKALDQDTQPVDVTESLVSKSP